MFASGVCSVSARMLSRTLLFLGIESGDGASAQERLYQQALSQIKKVLSRCQSYFAMQTFFGSVKNRRASSPPTPLYFKPPKLTGE
jgi:hypothetical protein